MVINLSFKKKFKNFQFTGVDIRDDLLKKAKNNLGVISY